MGDASLTWITTMRKELMKKGNFNVIVIDWSGGAKTIDYIQATANTRVAGDQIGELVKALPTSKSKVHIIGHSLGSHIASFASK